MVATSIDLETLRFGPGNMAPRPVVASVMREGAERRLLHMKERASWTEIDALLAVAHPEDVLVGHNVRYDLACLIHNDTDQTAMAKLVFDAMQNDGVTDTKVRQMLLDIATGKFRGFRGSAGAWTKNGYHLADLVSRHLGFELPKPQEIRTGYGDLYDVPLDRWSQAAIDYSGDDAEATLEVYLKQEEEAAKLPGVLEDQFRQTRAALALQLASVHGLRTDKAKVDALEARAKQAVEALAPLLADAGLLRAERDLWGNLVIGSRNTAAAVKRTQEVNPGAPRTEKGRIQVTAETCAECGDPALEAWGKFSKAQNILSKDIPMLRAGETEPLHTFFEEIVASGRTSSANPNVQNVKREPGLRECFVPREGFLYLACDYGKAELHALAEVCTQLFGWSKLGDALNAGKDPHLMLASDMLGLTYEEALQWQDEPEVKAGRQSAKACNFGFPAGLGVAKFLRYAKETYGIVMAEDEAEQGRSAWFKTWPEVEKYLRWIGDRVREGEATMTQVFSGRLRGGCGYTDAANTLFQGLTADFAKAAMFAVAREEYVETDSPLYGCRTVNFVHDELILEVPDDVDKANAAAWRLKEVMEKVAEPWTPHVPVKASPVLMKCWSKKAEAVHDVQGRLVPWDRAK